MTVMSLFHRGDTYRLEDRKPEKKKKKREVRPYKPLRPLSLLGCVLVLLVAAAMLCYGCVLLVMRFAGVETVAASNTRLDENGAVTQVELMQFNSTLRFTFRDADGNLHEGSTNLLGNQEPIGASVRIRYFPGHPEWVMLSSRTETLMIPLGCLLLSGILTYTGINRIKQLRSGKTEDPAGEDRSG